MSFRINLNHLIIVMLLSTIDLTCGIWTKVFSDSTIYINSIKCISNGENIVLANNYEFLPTIYKSKNQGIDWSISFNEKSLNGSSIANLSGIEVLTNDIYVVIAGDGKTLHTTDGGISWEMISLSTNRQLQSIQFLDTLNGIVTSDKNIFISKTGGMNWEEIFINSKLRNNPDTMIFYNAQILSSGNYILKARHKKNKDILYIFRTDDAGSTWTSYPFPNGCTGGMKFVDSLNGWSYGGDTIPETNDGRRTSKIVHTTDGGITWTVQLNDTLLKPNYTLTDIDFIDTLNGYAAGMMGKLIKTTDGGKTWIQIQLNQVISDNPPSMSISYQDRNTILISTYYGNVYRYEKPSNVGDGNNKKSDYQLFYPNPVNDFIFVNSEEPSNTQIISILGKVIIQSTRKVIDVSNLSPGLYFVKMGDKIDKFIKK